MSQGPSITLRNACRQALRNLDAQDADTRTIAKAVKQTAELVILEIDHPNQVEFALEMPAREK